MKTIRHSDEFTHLYEMESRLRDALNGMYRAIERLDSKFGGVKYEEYRIKDEKK